MGCCGDKRRAWREWAAASNGNSISKNAEIHPPALTNPVTLYHLSGPSLVMKGGVTGVTYLFGGRGTILNVDERDVPALLATKQFTSAPPETSVLPIEPDSG
jgi:hypothetical protein